MSMVFLSCLSISFPMYTLSMIICRLQIIIDRVYLQIANCQCQCPMYIHAPKL